MKPIILFCCLVFVFSSCQNEARWYPSADVSIGSQSEYTDAAGGKHLAVTVIIRNTSSASILSSTVTIKAATNKREYLQTAGSAAKIIPGSSIALPVSVDYLESDEQAVPGGVVLYDAFFD